MKKTPLFLQKLFNPVRVQMQPYILQLNAFLLQAAELLAEMFDVTEPEKWKQLNKEIKTLETHGDAMLTDFLHHMGKQFWRPVRWTDLVTMTLVLDDLMDVVKDCSNALVIYSPKKIDPQLRNLAQLVLSGAQALQDLVNCLPDFRGNAPAIIRQCDRLSALEHAADEMYEDYIGYIFSREPDIREMVKYKNLAEGLEKATDCAKHIGDGIRLLVAH